jgi:23S rRNA (cytosine1962-C5)-methyltransferase
MPDGATVEVRTSGGRALARGFWDAGSPIAVRLLESVGPGQRFTDPEALIAARLRSALERRLARLDLSRTNAFRWVHGEADLLPGIHVDVYRDVAVVRFDGGGARAFYGAIEKRLHDAARANLPLRAVVDRDEGRDGHAAPGLDVIEVLENGARFGVDVFHGQKGGLFLDQRANRLRVAERAHGKSLLNLFGYTGAFSVHAALAGATRTDTVDIARPAIEAARANFARNALDLTRAGFHVADAFDFLAAAAARGEHWDIVVSDPPSFAARKDTVPAARAAYTRLHRLVAAVTKPGGLLCASSCSSHFSRQEFLETIAAGVRPTGRRWTLEGVHGADFDHPVIPPFPEGDYLKFAIGRVW